MVRKKFWIASAFAGLLPSVVLIAFPPVVRTPEPFREEMAAKAAIKAVQSAETLYYSQYGVYAISIQQLGPPASGSPKPNGADLIDRDLTSGERRGFKFVLQQTQTGFSLNVNPVAFGTSGTHTYYSDQSMAIHEHHGPEPATASDPLLGETQLAKSSRICRV
jgi:hypothetical protein